MDKDKLRKALRQWSEPCMACESLSDEDMLDMVLDAAQAYLDILDGDKVAVPRQNTKAMERVYDDMQIGDKHGNLKYVPLDAMWMVLLAAAEKGE